MKILKYKLFLIKEQIENMPASYNDPTIEFLKNNLKQLEQSEESLDEIEDGDKEEFLSDFEKSLKGFPKVVRDFQLFVFRLFLNKKFRETYRNILTNMISYMESGKSLEDIQKEDWYIDSENELYNMIRNISGATKEQADELIKKFSFGSQKYKKIKEESVKISEEDPYGEEEWDGMTEEERIKKAFEEEN